jgi:VWFA-related protein
MPRCARLALYLCLPCLALAQLSAAQQGIGPESQVSPPGAPRDPVLTHRPPPKQPASVIPEGRIKLDVVVTGDAGKPVTGLGPMDFKILDNDQPRKILSFRSFAGNDAKPNPPVEVILVVDTVNLPFQQVAFIRQEIARFLRQNGGHLAQPLSFILFTDAGIRMQPRPSTDGNALLGIVDQIKGSISTINPAMGAEGDLMRFQRSVHQLANIAENEARRPSRKLLIWIGPGWPLLQGPNFTFTEKNQRDYFDSIVEISSRLREARMAVYSVAASGVGLGAGEVQRFVYQDFLKGARTPRQTDSANLSLKVIATQSGGRVLGPDNDIAGQINTCIEDAKVFYTLSFDPPPAAQADEYHDLKVLVGQPGLTVRTNTGYYNQP